MLLFTQQIASLVETLVGHSVLRLQLLQRRVQAFELSHLWCTHRHSHRYNVIVIMKNTREHAHAHTHVSVAPHPIYGSNRASFAVACHCQA